MPKPTKTANELPRARVLYTNPTNFEHDRQPFLWHRPIAYDKDEFACAVIPTRTAKEAKAIAAFFNLTREGRLCLMQRRYYDGCGNPSSFVGHAAVLDLITGRGK